MISPYNAGYRIPFPMLTVTLHTDESAVGPLSALLDTGADFTLIPTPVLEQIEAADVGQVRIQTHFGDSHLVTQYTVAVQVHETGLLWIYAIGDDEGNEVILGRDVLNKLPLFLDGPQRQTQLLDAATVKRLRARRPRA